MRMAPIALISVSDKSGIEDFGRALTRLGWSVLSTGGTAAALREAGCEVTDVSRHTGFPEILDGRVKTLHPKVFGGILATASEEHTQQIRKHEIPAIDMVVVNLYPFRETVARQDVSLAEAVEQIDIGGPSLIRAAAKNHDRVVVIVDPGDYSPVLAELAAGAVGEGTRRRLAVAAFRHTAAYDAHIAAHLPRLIAGTEPLPTALIASRLLSADEVILRYGENPHQVGVVARARPPRGLAGARQLQGKAMSYNNLCDATGAWRLVWDLPGPGAAIIKHANPCGVAVGEDIANAFRAARATDPVSAFGGVIATNRPAGVAFAQAVVEQFAEVVIAPTFEEGTAEVFERKKNLRVIEAEPADPSELVIRTIDGGYVIQTADCGWEGEEREVVTSTRPTDEQMQGLELAWRVVKHVSSNAIVIGANDRMLGIGAGQMSRVDAAKIAVAKAQEIGHELGGSVAASDAFFPFPDGVEALHASGVVAVIQPGGSIRDHEVVEACNRLGVAMVMTGRRHFRH